MCVCPVCVRRSSCAGTATLRETKRRHISTVNTSTICLGLFIHAISVLIDIVRRWMKLRTTVFLVTSTEELVFSSLSGCWLVGLFLSRIWGGGGGGVTQGITYSILLPFLKE